MNRLNFRLLLVLLVSCSQPTPEQYLFAGMPWGSNAEEVRNTLRLKGYVPETSEETWAGRFVYRFSGQIDGYETYVTARFNPDSTLLGVSVLLEVPGDEMEEYITGIVERLRDTYGVPKEVAFIRNERLFIV